jgi:TorA maturation chaperone TorD
MLTDTTSQQHSILKGYNMLLYFAGTMIMYEPSEECVVDFWNDGILKKLPVSSSNPVFVRAATQLRESCTDKSSSTNAMIEDYYRLFTRENVPLAPLYESIYQNFLPEERRSNVPDVSEFYNSYGWMKKFKPEMKDDHLGVELLFLTKLVEKYIILDDEACRTEMRNEIRRFIEQHILSWIPEWYRRVQANSLTISYKGISSLIYACAEDIHALLSEKNETFSRAVYLKN